VRWTTSKWSRISIPFSPRLRDHIWGVVLCLFHGLTCPWVSPAPWGCKALQYSHHFSHVFGRRARVCITCMRFIISARRVVLLPIVYGRGKDMSLPIYTSLYLTAVVSVLLLF
jgi:hypothetical protein